MTQTRDLPFMRNEVYIPQPTHTFIYLLEKFILKTQKHTYVVLDTTRLQTDTHLK